MFTTGTTWLEEIEKRYLKEIQDRERNSTDKRSLKKSNVLFDSLNTFSTESFLFFLLQS